MDKKIIIAGVIVAILAIAGYLLLFQAPVEQEKEETEKEDAYFYYFDAPFYTAKQSNLEESLLTDDSKGIVDVFKAELSDSSECPVYYKFVKSEINFTKEPITPEKYNGDAWGYYLGFKDSDARYKIIFQDYSSANTEESFTFFEVKNEKVTLMENQKC